MREPVLRCPLCRDTGRIRTSLPGGHPTWAPCPACPPSETVTEAMERAGQCRFSRPYRRGEKTDMTTITPAMAEAGAEAIKDALRFSAMPEYLARKAYRAMESARQHPPRPPATTEAERQP